MRVALLSYHRNAQLIYPSTWINHYRVSVQTQQFKNFTILENEYGGGNFRIFQNSVYEQKKFPTFIHNMNYLIEKALNMGFDCVSNSNVDDWFRSDMLKIQVPFIEEGYDVVSPNFSLVRDNLIYHKHHFENVDIKHELKKNHNPVAHPAVLYSRKFLENNRYNPAELPEEDLMLWKRTIDDYKFKIVPQNLLFHRVHDNAVCRSGNR